MIDPEYLDALLELWAREVLGDRAVYRGLGYPPATPEERWARRGGLPPASNPVSPVSEAPDAFVRIDRAMAGLRGANPMWFAVLRERMLAPGPDESRARRLRIEPRVFKIRLGSARRWLRGRLED